MALIYRAGVFCDAQLSINGMAMLKIKKAFVAEVCARARAHGSDLFLMMELEVSLARRTYSRATAEVNRYLT